jgi:hypothetical protein
MGMDRPKRLRRSFRLAHAVESGQQHTHGSDILNLGGVLLNISSSSRRSRKELQLLMERSIPLRAGTREAGAPCHAVAVLLWSQAAFPYFDDAFNDSVKVGMKFNLKRLEDQVMVIPRGISGIGLATTKRAAEGGKERVGIAGTLNDPAPSPGRHFPRVRRCWRQG